MGLWVRVLLFAAIMNSYKLQSCYSCFRNIHIYSYVMLWWKMYNNLNTKSLLDIKRSMMARWCCWLRWCWFLFIVYYYYYYYWIIFIIISIFMYYGNKHTHSSEIHIWILFGQTKGFIIVECTCSWHTSGSRGNCEYDIGACKMQFNLRRLVSEARRSTVCPFSICMYDVRRNWYPIEIETWILHNGVP